MPLIPQSSWYHQHFLLRPHPQPLGLQPTLKLSLRSCWSCQQQYTFGGELTTEVCVPNLTCWWHFEGGVSLSSDNPVITMPWRDVFLQDPGRPCDTASVWGRSGAGVSTWAQRCCRDMPRATGWVGVRARTGFSSGDLRWGKPCTLRGVWSDAGQFPLAI